MLRKVFIMFQLDSYSVLFLNMRVLLNSETENSHFILTDFFKINNNETKSVVLHYSKSTFMQRIYYSFVRMFLFLGYNSIVNQNFKYEALISFFQNHICRFRLEVCGSGLLYTIFNISRTKTYFVDVCQYKILRWRYMEYGIRRME